MSKKPAAKRARTEPLRDEYDLSQMSGVRGKYLKATIEQSNLVLIEPDLAELFPDAASVNRALRVLADAAKVGVPAGRARQPR